MVNHSWIPTGFGFAAPSECKITNNKISSCKRGAIGFHGPFGMALDPQKKYAYVTDGEYAHIWRCTLNQETVMEDCVIQINGEGSQNRCGSGTTEPPSDCAYNQFYSVNDFQDKLYITDFGPLKHALYICDKSTKNIKFCEHQDFLDEELDRKAIRFLTIHNNVAYFSEVSQIDGKSIINACDINSESGLVKMNSCQKIYCLNDL